MADASSMAARLLSSGGTIAPRKYRRSPLIRQMWSRMRTDRKPILRTAESLIAPSSVATVSCRSNKGWSPSSRGHHSGGRGTRTRHSRLFSPAASGWGCRWSMPNTVVRNTTGRGRAVSTTARTARVATVGVASVHTTRRCLRATGPVSRRPTGLQIPPGFQPRWVTPVRVRPTPEEGSGGQATSTANRWSRCRRRRSVTSRR